MRPCLVVLVCLILLVAQHPGQLQARNAAIPARVATSATSGQVQALLAQAQAAFDKKQYVTALRLFTEATQLAPTNAVAWAGKARSESYLNDDKDAVIDYTRAIQYAPTNAVYYLRRGLSYDDLGNYQDALADYTTAIRLNPHYEAAYFDIGALYFNLHNYALAITYYSHAIRLDPADTQAYYNRAEAEAWLGQYQAAIADFTAYIHHTRHLACKCAYNERGLAYFALHEYAPALKDFQQAVAIDPTDAGDFDNCALASYNLHLYAQGIRYASKAIALRPTYAQAYYFRGLNRLRLGDKAGAIADLKQAWTLYTVQGDDADAAAVAAVLNPLVS